MPSRLRQIYQTDLLYVGPTGAANCTGALNSAGVYGNILSAISGNSLISPLYRVKSVNDDWAKQQQDVNQLGELAAIDRVSLQPPTVNLSFSYLLANMVNESLLGFTVSKAGDASLVSAISGIIAQNTDSKNYFLKSVDQGQDAIDYAPTSYQVKAFGNGYISSYTSQGSVGEFPTVDISLSALNVQQQTITQTVGGVTPAVNATDGTAITGRGYILPTGFTSFGDASLTNANGLGISVLRPGDITLNLGLAAGDGFVDESDMKAQSYNISLNFNQEDLNKLGSKYAYAKVPVFPLAITMSCSALIGDNQTGNLIDIVNNNKDFNPTITIKSPNDSTKVAAFYKLAGAKLDSQNFTASIGSNKSVTMNFSSTVAGPLELTRGFFMSGITV
jgi:hypothetical protein